LYHLRERASELAGRLGQGPHGRSPLVVVVLCSSASAGSATAQVQQALASQAATSTIPVAGAIAMDRRAVEALRAMPSRRLYGSDLLRSARAVADTLITWFPELLGRADTAGLSPQSDPSGDGSPTLAGPDHNPYLPPVTQHVQVPGSSAWGQR
ncbi:MAG: hypothetical protein ACRDQ1_15570, partial [Sciscionella sp.]